MPDSNPELEALRNLIVEAHAIISTGALPEGRCQRATEVLNAAIALVDDLLKVGTRLSAAALGAKGGNKTAERGPKYFKKIAAKRKTFAGGRPRKHSD